MRATAGYGGRSRRGTATSELPHGELGPGPERIVSIHRSGGGYKLDVAGRTVDVDAGIINRQTVPQQQVAKCPSKFTTKGKDGSNGTDAPSCAWATVRKYVRAAVRPTLAPKLIMKLISYDQNGSIRLSIHPLIVKLINHQSAAFMPASIRSRLN